MRNRFVDYNITLLTDFYELTMAHGYFKHGFKDKIGYFDYFFRTNPDNGGFVITAGLDQLIDYIVNLKFEEHDIEYLRSKNLFEEEFLDYLRNFKFECDLWAVPEGTPVFPNEPIITVKGPMIQAQFIETIVLLAMNHQSLICTKSNRIVRSAKGRDVIEFGARRAQGFDASVFGARAAYIGGCAGTSCAIAERDLKIPASGTIAHSWIQLFENEYDAFKAYAEMYPDNTILLVDTYNTLKQGIPNAIRVFDEVLKPLGHRPLGIRIDSGDLTYLSKKARLMLDEAGYKDCKIVASNSLDEHIIREMLLQGAKVDIFGVGENLITSKSAPVIGGVYKLVAIEEKNQIIPKIKLSENVIKITNPGFKEIWRLYDKTTKKAIADVITLMDEDLTDIETYEMFDPTFTWKRNTFDNFEIKRLRVKVFDKGELVYKSPSVTEIRKYCKKQVETLWTEILRFENPHKYIVDLSEKLWNVKHDLIKTMSGK